MAFTLTEPKATAEDLLQISFPILKWEEDADGDLIVKGIATDGTVDSDEQIVDPVWSAKALNNWSATGANVRQSHDPRHPVGKGLSVEIDRNGSGKHWVTSVIVDPLAQKLVKKGVLTAYSIGISRPVIKHDPSGKARGGIIMGGELAELSIVDRPSNKSSYLEIAKSAANGDIEFTGKMHADDDVIAKFSAPEIHKGGLVLQDGRDSISFTDDDMSLTFTPADLAKILKSKIIENHYDELALKALYEAEEAVYKRNVNTAERRSLASSGHALSDGSYPIANAGDLHNAAHLAETGHGNAEAAKRLIARRAEELGVANPLNDSEDSGKGINSVVDETPAEVLKDESVVKEAEPEVTKEPEDTVEADEPGNKAKKPKGKKMPPWLNKPDDDSGEDSDDSCKEEHAHTEKCTPSGTPQSASGATDAAPMDEIPNKGPAPESPMPAGRKTPDTKAMGSNPEASAMIRFKTLGIDTDLGRLHDMTCPAYSPDDVAKYHPYSDFDSLIDLDVWQRKAVDSACGPLDKAFELTQVWSAAQTLKSYDPAELNDMRLEAHKAFRDANPGVSSYPSPGMMSPGKFNRGVISGGHAANSPGYDGPNSSPDVATGPPHAGSFNRPPLGSGHQTPSPSFMKGNDGQYPETQGTPTNLTYMHIEKDKARRSLAMMHDHISHQFPAACPLVEQDAYRQPEARMVPPTEGLGKTVEPEVQAKAVSDATPEIPRDITKGMKKKLAKKVLSGKMTVDEARGKLGRRMAQKAMEDQLHEQLVKGEITREDAMKALGFEVPEVVAKAATIREAEVIAPPVTPAMSPDIIKSAIAEALAPLVAKVEAQQQVINEQEARWEAKANEADPSTSSWRGLALKSRQPVAVVKQAEIAERTQREIAESRQLRHTWRTSDNAFEREAARSELDKRGFAE